MNTTLEYAETHFSQLLRLVAEGEEVLLRNGTVPVARIVPIPPVCAARPKVGEITSARVRWQVVSPDGAFPAYGISLLWWQSVAAEIPDTG